MGICGFVAVGMELVGIIKASRKMAMKVLKNFNEFVWALMIFTLVSMFDCIELSFSFY